MHMAISSGPITCELPGACRELLACAHGLDLIYHKSRSISGQEIAWAAHDQGASDHKGCEQCPELQRISAEHESTKRLLPNGSAWSAVMAAIHRQCLHLACKPWLQNVAAGKQRCCSHTHSAGGLVSMHALMLASCQSPCIMAVYRPLHTACASSSLRLLRSLLVHSPSSCTLPPLPSARASMVLGSDEHAQAAELSGAPPSFKHSAFFEDLRTCA